MHKEGGEPVARNRLGEMMTRLAAVLAEGGVEAARALCTTERLRNRQEQLSTVTGLLWRRRRRRRSRMVKLMAVRAIAHGRRGSSCCGDDATIFCWACSTGQWTVLWRVLEYVFADGLGCLCVDEVRASQIANL